MNYVYIGAVVCLAIFVGGCRAKRAEKVVPVIEIEEVVPEVEAVPPVPVQIDEPVRTVVEQFTFTRDEDMVAHERHQFFVIMGSFRIRRNAENFTNQLIRKGFEPVILLSETGMHRVSVNSFDNEDQARQRVLQIRRSFPQHADTWLLRRR